MTSTQIPVDQWDVNGERDGDVFIHGLGARVDVTTQGAHKTARVDVDYDDMEAHGALDPETTFVATTDASQDNLVIVQGKSVTGGSGIPIEALTIDTKKMANRMTEEYGRDGVFVPGGMSLRIRDTTGGLYGIRVGGMHSLGARADDGMVGSAEVSKYDPMTCEATHVASYDHVIGCGNHPATGDGGVHYAFNTSGQPGHTQLSSDAARHLLTWNGMSPKKLLNEAPVQQLVSADGDVLERVRVVAAKVKDPKIDPADLEDGAEHPMVPNPLASIIHKNYMRFPEDRMPQIHTDQLGAQFIHVDDGELDSIVKDIQAQAVEVRGMKPAARIFVTPLHDGPPPNPDGHLIISAGIHGSVCTPTIRSTAMN